MARIGVMGGGPEAAALAFVLSEECDDEIVLIANFLGRGFTPIGLPFTEKVNLRSQDDTLRNLKKPIDNSSPTRVRLVYAVETSSVFHAVRRIGSALWRKGVKTLGQVRLEENPPEEYKGLFEGAGPPGFIIVDARIARAPRLFLSIVRRLRDVEKVVFSPQTRVEISDNELRGVATARGYERLDGLVLVGTPDSSLGLGLETLLPRKVRVEAPIHPPLGWLDLALATPKAMVLQAQGSAWMTVQADYTSEETALAGAAEVASRLPLLRWAALPSAVVETVLSSPDSSPVAGRLEGWPDGVYVVAPCPKSCFTVSWGVGRTVCEELQGGRGEYSISRILEKRLFREYLQLP